LILGAGEEGPGLKPVFIAALIVTAEAVTYRLATSGNLFVAAAPYATSLRY
jgi:hypothetical protein